MFSGKHRLISRFLSTRNLSKPYFRWTHKVLIWQRQYSFFLELKISHFILPSAFLNLIYLQRLLNWFDYLCPKSTTNIFYVYNLHMCVCSMCSIWHSLLLLKSASVYCPWFAFSANLFLKSSVSPPPTMFHLSGNRSSRKPGNVELKWHSFSLSTQLGAIVTLISGLIDEDGNLRVYILNAEIGSLLFFEFWVPTLSTIIEVLVHFIIS